MEKGGKITTTSFDGSKIWSGKRIGMVVKRQAIDAKQAHFDFFEFIFSTIPAGRSTFVAPVSDEDMDQLTCPVKGEPVLDDIHSK